MTGKNEGIHTHNPDSGSRLAALAWYFPSTQGPLIPNTTIKNIFK